MSVVHERGGVATGGRGASPGRPRLSHHAARRGPGGRRRRGERGAILVITALLLTSVVLIAAVVVDIGNVYAHRRTDQASADSAALGSAQELGDDPDVVAAVKTLAHENLNVELTSEQWDSCGAEAGSLPVAAAGASCITFNRARSRVRVRIPDQYLPTGFSSIMGIDEVRHAAAAVAAVTQRGFGGVLPFGMPSGAGSGDGYACIKSNSGGLASAPCNGPDSGNFGTIDLGQFGNEDLGTGQSCGSGDSRPRIANNIAVGSDHDLTEAGTSATKVDTELCVTLSPGSNAAKTETGNNQGPVGSGMFSGSTFSDGGPARLKRTDPALFDGAGRTRLVHGHTVDDNPLWQFIPPTLRSTTEASGQIPKSCEREQFVNAAGVPSTASLPSAVRVHLAGLDVADRMLLLLQRCMTHYRGQAWGGGAEAGLPALVPSEPRQGCAGPTSTAPCTAPVFGRDSSSGDSPDLYDIQYTPRFAYVPEIQGSFPSGSSTPVRFQAFRPVFIQRLVVGNGAGATSFDPGVGSVPTSPTKDDLREVTLWVFPDGMLPGRLGEPDAPYAIGVNRFVQLVA